MPTPGRFPAKAVNAASRSTSGSVGHARSASFAASIAWEGRSASAERKRLAQSTRSEPSSAARSRNGSTSGERA